ncbi:MAG: recombination protein O N-terminal domain-containing protein [Phycisphaerales bacterium]|nr:recombination protein O N-terminal domain-containing protein [Phycisphaerales bacterium]
MATITDHGLVLRQWEFSETSQTVLLFCRTHGLLRGLAKGAHRDKAPFSGGFELLTRGEIVAIPKGANDLANLIEWDLQEVFWGPRRSWSCYQSGLYIIDVLRHMLIDADPHPMLFDGAVAALRALGQATDPQAILTFQWLVLHETGYEPRLELDQSEPSRAAAFGFDPQTGGLTTDPGPGSADTPWRVRRGTVEVLRHVRDQGDPGPARPEQVDRAMRLLGQYLRLLGGQERGEGVALLGAEPLVRSRRAGAVR